MRRRRVKEGKEPYFVPGIKRELTKYGLTEKLKNLVDRIGIKAATPLQINTV